VNAILDLVLVLVAVFAHRLVLHVTQDVKLAAVDQTAMELPALSVKKDTS
jgi:hypothetical protein